MRLFQSLVKCHVPICYGDILSTDFAICHQFDDFGSNIFW